MSARIARLLPAAALVVFAASVAWIAILVFTKANSRADDLGWPFFLAGGVITFFSLAIMAAFEFSRSRAARHP